MAWKCDYCNKKFENKKDCEEHEVKCRKNRIQKDIFIAKWIIFSVMILFSLITFFYRWFFASLGLLMALFFVPFLEKFLDKKYNFKIKFWLKCVILIIFFFLFVVTTPSCGDNRCNGNENSISCVEDCGSFCGDGVCNGDETKCNCVEDCGNCSANKVCEEAVCNEDKCIINKKENCCGNGIIEVGETCSSCEKDVVCEKDKICFSNECVKLNWKCSSWSNCNKEGIQTRTCVEEHNLNINKPVESQACEYIPGVGDSLISGNFKYTFLGLEEEDYLADTYFIKEANGVYYILEFKIENIGKEQDYIPLNQILIIDSLGREYSYDSSSGYYLYEGISSYEELNPGLSIRGKIAFDVPKGLNGELKIGDGNYYEPIYKIFRLS